MTKNVTIGVVQYGAGNQASVINAMESIGMKCVSVNIPSDLALVDKLIIPGVGHAGDAMIRLQSTGLDEAIKQTKLPLLGICLGMQLLGVRSDEGNTNCLSICNFETVRFNILLKVPQMGWNKVKMNNNPLFSGLNKDDWFYFVHSYYVPHVKYSIAQCNYGVEFAAAIQYQNFWGVQFHPEKSGVNGLKLLKNFVELCY